MKKQEIAVKIKSEKSQKECNAEAKFLIIVFFSLVGYSRSVERKRSGYQGSRPPHERSASLSCQPSTSSNPGSLPTSPWSPLLAAVLPVGRSSQPQEPRGPDAAHLSLAAHATLWNVTLATAASEPADNSFVSIEQSCSTEFWRKPTKLELWGTI